MRPRPGGSLAILEFGFPWIPGIKQAYRASNARTSKWDPPKRFTLIETSFVDVQDPVERKYLNGLPTSFHLPEQAVTRLRRAARDVLREDPAFRALTTRLAAMR